jgi:hypothetical protein
MFLTKDFACLLDLAPAVICSRNILHGCELKKDLEIILIIGSNACLQVLKDGSRFERWWYGPDRTSVYADDVVGGFDSWAEFCLRSLAFKITTRWPRSTHLNSKPSHPHPITFTASIRIAIPICSRYYLVVRLLCILPSLPHLSDS